MTGHNRYKVMSNELVSKTDPGDPMVYQIRLKGHLGSQWTDWFEGLTITLEEDGNTLLTGPVIDQAALHGLLKKVRDLGMPLVSVIQAQFNETNPYRSIKEKKMDPIKKTTEIKDGKVILSTLWIFAMFNYLYADVMTLMDPELLKKFMSGYVGSMQITRGFLFGAAVLMETAIAMVLLSRILKHEANRWANILAGVIHTLVVFFSLFAGKPVFHLMFFAIIEIACTLFIVWYAWKWTNPEGKPE